MFWQSIIFLHIYYLLIVVLSELTVLAVLDKERSLVDTKTSLALKLS
jgi:hypothetical protein